MQIVPQKSNHLFSFVQNNFGFPQTHVLLGGGTACEGGITGLFFSRKHFSHQLRPLLGGFLPHLLHLSLEL